METLLKPFSALDKPSGSALKPLPGKPGEEIEMRPLLGGKPLSSTGSSGSKSEPLTALVDAAASADALRSDGSEPSSTEESARADAEAARVAAEEEEALMASHYRALNGGPDEDEDDALFGLPSGGGGGMDDDREVDDLEGGLLDLSDRHFKLLSNLEMQKQKTESELMLEHLPKMRATQHLLTTFYNQFVLTTLASHISCHLREASDKHKDDVLEQEVHAREQKALEAMRALEEAEVLEAAEKAAKGADKGKKGDKNKRKKVR